jgi:uncharacterized repeat protein (TIGR01451 family)
LKKLSVSALFVALAILSATPVLAQEADLFVEKAGPSQAAPDTDVTYTVSLTNLGPDTAASVTLSDAMPAGMMFVSGTDDSADFTCTYPAAGDTSGTITCDAQTFAADSVANFTFVFHIPADTAPGTTFVNVATASTLTFDPNEENNSGTVGTTTPPPAQADLGVSKSGPSSAAPDTDVVYTIELRNVGPDDAADVELSDTLPGDMTFVSFVQNSGPAMTCTPLPAPGAGGTVTCTAATLAAGATATFTLTTHVPADTASGTVYTNTANATADTEDPNADDNSATTSLTISSADMSVTKSGPATATAGDQISYTIIVTNNGPDAAAATLIDPLPPDTTFVSLTKNSGPPALCTTPPVGADGTVSCEFETLAAAASAQFTLVVEIGNTSSVTNTATVFTNSGDPNDTNDSATVVTAVTSSADLSVAKTGPATAAAGAMITYDVTVTNDGPSDAANATLIDATPPSTTFVSAMQTSGPTFSCTAPGVGGTGDIVCSIATLAPGVSATFSLTMQVSPSAPNGSTITNTADVAATTADPNAPNNTATSTATISASADVEVTKNGPSTVRPDTDVTYNVTVSNDGPADAADVTLTDVLPPNTTFVSATQTSGPTFNCTRPPVGTTGTITCTIATLPANATATFDFVVHVNPQASGSIENTATVTSPSDPTPGNNAGTTAAAVTVVQVPTLSTLALALLALSLAVIVVVMRS